MTGRSFDLEAALDTWRSFFKYRRSFFSDDMEELEQHVRDHIAQLIDAGYSEEEAFREATSKLGGVADLGEEYEQVYWSKIRFRGQFASSAFQQAALIRNYVTSALRNIVKYKGYSALNITGLVVGLAAAFLVFLWIDGELSVDAFHENGDRLYQVKINSVGETETSTWSNVPAPLASALESTYPEVEASTLSLPIRVSLNKNGRASREVGHFVGPAFFESFTFPLILGDPTTVLSGRGGIAISERTATRLFGPDWRTTGSVLGEPISMDNWQSNGGVLGNAIQIDDRKELTITGVFADVPAQSSLKFDFVLPVSEVLDTFPHLAGWGPRWFNLTVLLAETADAARLQEKIRGVVAENELSAVNHEVFLQPYDETYLNSTFRDGQPSGGRSRRLALMGLVGLAILLIACINFTNLLTARSSQRASEIAVRKVVGATPSSLVQQYLGESLVTAGIASAGAVVLMAAMLPVFGSVTGTHVSIGDISVGTWCVFAGITVITGLGAGLYPALILSSTNVTSIIRGNSGSVRHGRVGVRQALVVVQFTISAFLIVGTLTVRDQLEFLRTKDLGMDVGNVISTRVEGELGTQFGAVKNQLEQSTAIASVSQTSQHPLAVATMMSNVEWEGKQESDQILFKVLYADDRFAETMRLRLVDGRFHDGTVDSAQLNYIVNEEAVRVLGLERPVGHRFALGHELDNSNSGSGKIIGVVENFHTGSLSEERIGPLVIGLLKEDGHFVLARVQPGQEATGMAELRSVFQRYNPDYPFEGAFLDDTSEEFYANQQVVEVLSRSFAGIAIVIACLGLLGLAAFSVQQRTIEIGIRRVLGASSPHLMYILSRELLILVTASLVVALPLAYLSMDHWLSSFAYRMELGTMPMLAAAGLSIGIAVLTVGIQAAKASSMRPADLLSH